MSKLITLTTKVADKLIKSGTVSAYQTNYGDVFTGSMLSRDKRTVYIKYTMHGDTQEYDGAFTRSDLQVIVDA